MLVGHTVGALMAHRCFNPGALGGLTPTKQADSYHTPTTPAGRPGLVGEPGHYHCDNLRRRTASKLISGYQQYLADIPPILNEVVRLCGFGEAERFGDLRLDDALPP